MAVPSGGPYVLTPAYIDNLVLDIFLPPGFPDTANPELRITTKQNPPAEYQTWWFTKNRTDGLVAVMPYRGSVAVHTGKTNSDVCNAVNLKPFGETGPDDPEILWKLVDAGNGTYYVRNSDGKRDFNCSGFGKNSGTAVVAWPSDYGNNSKWRITPTTV